MDTTTKVIEILAAQALRDPATIGPQDTLATLGLDSLGLVEVIFAAAVSRYVFRQPVTGRQVVGMAVICAGVGWLLRLHG